MSSIDKALEAVREKALTSLLAKETGDVAARAPFAKELAENAHSAGVKALPAIIAKLTAALADKKNQGAREGALLGFGALASSFGQPAAPYLFPCFSVLTNAAAAGASEKAAAESAVAAVFATLHPNGIRFAAPHIFEAALSKYKWQSRILALSYVGKFAALAPKQTTQAMPELIPGLSQFMGDARAEVSKEAESALLSVCSVVNNKDIEPFIPTLVSCIARPDEVNECVYKLSSTTFVQAVEPPTLAIIMPVLERGLKQRDLATKRKVAVIIDNMCKLVEVPAFAEPFLPKLLPGLDRAKEETSDPDVRKICETAHKILLKAAGDGASKDKMYISGVTGIEITKSDPVKQLTTLQECLTAGNAELPADAAVTQPMLDYITSLSGSLYDENEFGENEWAGIFTPFVGALLQGSSALMLNPNQVRDGAAGFLARCFRNVAGAAKEADDDVGEVLCDCEFSLAYGAKILLNQARMHLRRGMRYGLCGHNGCGKSTLMRAIANGQVENFPDPDVVRTVYVEHDIQADQTEFSVVQFVMVDKRLSDEALIRKTLAELSFTPAMMDGVVTALSGGWKMKLALAKAILLKADIMLLDEPTNHLDKINKAWLMDYLCSLHNVTCIIVSHDSGFLDKVCTHIIHYENFKLKRYKGNLSEFVKKVPEARSYYELSATPIEFKFPEPGMLEGITSKGKSILKMMNVSYKYPGYDRMIINNVTVQVALSSRVVVVGANGAGKSTMIKCLTGETIPTMGTVWKHPNLRIAYVAQHAFHHIEEHLDKSPNEYIQWRYCSGEDKEAQTKEARQLTDEEEKKMAEKVTIDGQKYVVEQLMGRRKLKSSYEYEVKFQGLGIDKNQWLPRKWLEEKGFGKMVDML